MNWDIIQGKWGQFKGSIKDKWGQLTDDDIDRINGNRDMLIGKLQEKYGWAREQAESAANDWANEVENRGSENWQSETGSRTPQ
jgi:uncharacterized protein YjbJ (UPF0337 family)